MGGGFQNYGLGKDTRFTYIYIAYVDLIQWTKSYIRLHHKTGFITTSKLRRILPRDVITGKL